MDHVGVIFYKRIIDAVYSLLDFLERFLFIKYPPVFIVGTVFLYFEYNKASFPCQKYESHLNSMVHIYLLQQYSKV